MSVKKSISSSLHSDFVPKYSIYFHRKNNLIFMSTCMFVSLWVVCTGLFARCGLPCRTTDDYFTYKKITKVLIDPQVERCFLSREWEQVRCSISRARAGAGVPVFWSGAVSTSGLWWWLLTMLFRSATDG